MLNQIHPVICHAALDEDFESFQISWRPIKFKTCKKKPTVFYSNPGAHNGWSPMHGAMTIFVNDDAAKQPWSC